MRFIITVALVCISYLSQGQDIMFRLTGGSERTWVGQSAYVKSSAENTMNFTFYKNHTVVPYSAKYHKKMPAEHWMLIKGDYTDDQDVILQIGKRQYHIEFSKTNNGRDFMVMTTTMVGTEDEVISNTYFAE